MLDKIIVLLFILTTHTFSISSACTIESNSNSEELLKILTNLKVAPDCKLGKYSRKNWKHWITEEKGGYNTRQKVLLEESLINPMVKKGSKKIIKGRWYGAYIDKLFNNPSDLDIDHLVPLGEAYKSGGCHWSKEKKKEYANYLKHKEELIAVSKGANRAKGQKDPAKWLPENQDYICEYVSNWLVVKNRWDLWIDKAEKKAIAKAIEDYCNGPEAICIQ